MHELHQHVVGQLALRSLRWRQERVLLLSSDALEHRVQVEQTCHSLEAKSELAPVLRHAREGWRARDAAKVDQSRGQLLERLAELVGLIVLVIDVTRLSDEVVPWHPAHRPIRACRRLAVRAVGAEVLVRVRHVDELTVAVAHLADFHLRHACVPRLTFKGGATFSMLGSTGCLNKTGNFRRCGSLFSDRLLRCLGLVPL